MNKKILLTAFIALILLLSSCGNNYSSSLNIKLDLDNRGNTFENLYNFGMIANDENIYFASIFEGLYKFNIDSNETTELLDVRAKSLNVLNGWIYYVKTDDNGIYKVDSNGNDNQKISEIKATSIYVQNDIIYVHGIFQGFNNNIYVMDINGNAERPLIDARVHQFYVYDDFVYYIESAPTERHQRIGRMRLDGSEQEIIVERFASIDLVTINSDNLFYIAAGDLYEVDLIDFSEQKILEMGHHMSSTRNIYQNKFYYTTSEISFFNIRLRLRSFDLITHETKRTTIPRLNKQGNIMDIVDYIIGDKIFRNENNKFYIMNLDGSGIQPFPDYSRTK